MPDLEHWIAQQLKLPITAIALEPASADASFRRYYRLQIATDSLIVMDASAERSSCEPFMQIARVLSAGGLNAPRILAAAPERGWMLLSDLGRQTYLDVLNAENADRLFEAAIAALIAMQKIPCPVELPAYDAALLRRELELFPVWYLQSHLGLEIDSALRADLDAVFDLLLAQILQQPRVLVHRDFMPRNLMFSDPLPGVLDFQDAVCGPIAYDPICLFKDAFISWPETCVEQWLQQYWQRASAAQLPVASTFAQFYRDCDFIGTQRHLKVIGIFARICHRDGKPKYLSDVPRFFDYLRGACARRSELKPLAALLEKLPAP
ncbi:MAG TPA: phosphotransferase [Spongiibacteraceae bacterium]|jgi:hypothetical protein